MGEPAVAPLAGAWIEIVSPRYLLGPAAVAPLAGAWIEIVILLPPVHSVLGSLPSRERGLKFVHELEVLRAHVGRSPRGSVD